ncbi:TadE/TadG family type IV pilus assembly protein [Phenylobacterium terrae]|uniref:TadE/TadG family type IV pilus assembly protein n=1 Tax=Phenylobacterium terrae TaxID=2665495 RepID=A0ABW4MZ02_9CAUL
MEFALIAPFLTMLLVGIMTYGGYFWTAHSVQQLANDSARAAIAGLDAQERQEIAEATLAAGLAHHPFLDPDRAGVTVMEAAEGVAVSVTFDASESFIFLFDFIPMPPPIIDRQAAVRLGGY